MPPRIRSLVLVGGLEPVNGSLVPPLVAVDSHVYVAIRALAHIATLPMRWISVSSMTTSRPLRVSRAICWPDRPPANKLPRH